MAINYPGSLDTDGVVGGGAEPDAADALDSSAGHPTHSGLHQNLGDAVQQLETKVGIGAATPTANRVLLSTVTSESSWGQVDTAMIAGSAVTNAKIDSVAFSKVTGTVTADDVDVTDTNSNSASFKLLISNGTGAGQTVYSVSGVYVNPAFDRLYSTYLTATGSGSSSLPSFAFDDGSVDTGFYLQGTHAIGVTAGATRTAVFTETGVGFSPSLATGTGDNAELVSTTVNSETFYVLRRDPSTLAMKSGISDWALTDDQFKAMQPRSFVMNHQYVTPEGLFGTTFGDDVDDEIPEGSVLLRRSGFIYEELLGVDLHLVKNETIDWKAVAAGTVGKVQELMARVEALEAV